MLSIKSIFTTLTLLITLNITAQINGNKKSETRSFPLENITSFNLELYANVTIDPTMDEGLTVTAESNLFEYIGRDVSSRRLSITQKEWVQPTKLIQITIGSPNVKKIKLTNWGEVSVINLDNERIEIDANVGTVNLSGKTDKLVLDIGQATVNADELIVQNAVVKSSGYADIHLNVIQNLDTDIDMQKTKITLVNEPKRRTGNFNPELSEMLKEQYKNVKWIDFKIKNNSWNRKNFYVVGPKKDGSTFSYGFPMLPGATRNEHWTIGTKVYKESLIGTRKLLVTITESDEGSTVDLFDD